MLLKLLVFLFVTTGITLGQGPETTCPPADLLSPFCACSKGCDLCRATVECSEVFNFGDLEETVFKNTKDWTFWHFSIVRSSFPFIPSNAIVEKRVRNLYLRNNTLSRMFDEPPPTTNLLKELELTDLRLLGGVRWDVYSTLVHLKEINMTNIEIRKIDKEFVQHFPQGLTGLYFKQTRTKRLGDDAFSNLVNLTRLFIRDTQISELKRSMFPPVSKLIAMYFSGNQINSLPDDLFTNMPDLRGVDFSNTNVVTLPESVFGIIMPRLSVLYLEGNTVNCNCEMKWIPKLKVLPYYARVECTRPKELEGLTLKNLKESHFTHCE